MYSSKDLLMGLALAVATLPSCGDERKQETAANNASGPAVPDAMQPFYDQVSDHGYIDLGEGVFLIPGQSHRNLSNQIGMGQAVAAFIRKNPNLEIIREIKLDGDSAYGHTYGSSHRIDGILLLTKPK